MAATLTTSKDIFGRKKEEISEVSFDLSKLREDPKMAPSLCIETALRVKITAREAEKILRREGLVEKKDRKSVIAQDIDFAERCFAPSQRFRFPRIEEFLDTPEEIQKFISRVNADPEFRRIALENRTPISSVLSEACGPMPGDYKDACLRDLWQSRRFGNHEYCLLANYNTKPRPEYFSKPTSEHLFFIMQDKRTYYDMKLEMAAFLATRAIGNESLIETIVPALDFAEFQSKQSKVFSEVEKALPPRARKFFEFLSLLTDKQRKALSSTILENHERIPYKEIAENLGLSLNALNERIKSAKRILIQHFSPEIVPPTEGEQKKRQKEKNRNQKCYIKHWGLFRVRTNGRRLPLYKIDLKTQKRAGGIKLKNFEYPQNPTIQEGFLSQRSFLLKTIPKHKTFNGMFFDGGASLFLRPNRKIEILEGPIQWIFREAPKRAKLTDPIDDDPWNQHTTDDEIEKKSHKYAGFDPKNARERLRAIRQIEAWEKEEINSKFQRK